MLDRTRDDLDGLSTMSASEAAQFLTPDLRLFLADLDGAPPSIAEAAVQLLPFGSRSALLAIGLVTADGGGAGTAGSEPGLRLTDLAFEVIAEAAAAPVGDGRPGASAKQAEIERLSTLAADIVAEHGSRR
jgi:hypothetical protein